MATTKHHSLPTDITLYRELSLDPKTSRRYVDINVQGIGCITLTRLVEDGYITYITYDFAREMGLETLVAQCIEKES